MFLNSDTRVFRQARRWYWWGLLGSLAVAEAYGQGGSSGARPTFEVASVRPSPPASAGLDIVFDQMYDSKPFRDVPTDPSRTRVTLKRRSIASLIAMSYRILVTDVLGPAWISEERFEIAATLPKDVSPNLASEMMQSLLEDRFALKYHWEKRQQTVYALVVGKGGPKLRPFTPQPVPDSASSLANDAVPPLPDLPAWSSKPLDLTQMAPWIHQRGATMADLARVLSRFVGERVIDMTGLGGKYDVMIAGFGPRSDQADATGLSVLDSIKDLGLRLERRKAELDVVVVDSCNKRPTEN